MFTVAYWRSSNIGRHESIHFCCCLVFLFFGFNLKIIIIKHIKNCIYYMNFNFKLFVQLQSHSRATRWAGCMFPACRGELGSARNTDLPFSRNVTVGWERRLLMEDERGRFEKPIGSQLVSLGATRPWKPLTTNTSTLAQTVRHVGQLTPSLVIEIEAVRVFHSS